MAKKLLDSSRYLILVAVIGAYLASAIVILYGGVLLIHIIMELFLHPNLSTGSGRMLALECIELVDTFLLGTAFFIVAVGLYELFINRHAAPGWLHVSTLEDLKAKLLGVVIVVLSVSFLEQIINWDGRRDILSLGIAEALVIGAITLTIRLHTRNIAESGENETAEGS